MDFGMPVLIEKSTLEENVALCKELGLDFVEINMSFPEYQIEKLENIEKLKKIKEEAGIYYTIHLDENLNVADFNQSVASAYVETVRRTIRVAKELDIPNLNMHMHHGIYCTLPTQKVQLFEAYFDDYTNGFERYRQMCEAEIADSNIKICIENTDGYSECERNMIQSLLDSKVFGLTWDIGHSNCAKNVDEPFLMKNESKLNHFHIHDALGKQDHMLLGTGEVDLKQRLDLAKKWNCRCVIETKTADALRNSVVWLKENGYFNR